MFEIINITYADRTAANNEMQGTKSKFWYTDKRGNDRLFKFEHRNTGEDWAEKVASEICNLLGLPHVRYELATYHGADGKEYRGVVCFNFVPPEHGLIHGDDLLMSRDPKYPTNPQKYKVRQYTIQAITAALDKVLPVQDAEMRDNNLLITAADYFVGYLMLDAWIANQDRHHENWGVIQNPDEDTLSLSPTFDHGAGLANHISDKERTERLTTKDRCRTIKEYVKKARSAIYLSETDKSPMTTLDAWKVFSKQCPRAAAYWIARMTNVDTEHIGQILQNIPPHRMSSVSREFTLQLLQENMLRLQENLYE